MKNKMQTCPFAVSRLEMEGTPQVGKKVKVRMVNDETTLSVRVTRV